MRLLDAAYDPRMVESLILGAVFGFATTTWIGLLLVGTKIGDDVTTT